MKQTLIDYLNKNRNAVVYVLDDPAFGFSEASGLVYRFLQNGEEGTIEGGYCDDLDDEKFLKALSEEAGFETVFDIETLLKEEEWDNYLVYTKQKPKKKKKILYKVIKLHDMYLSYETNYSSSFNDVVLSKTRKNIAHTFFEDDGVYISENDEYDLNSFIRDLKKDTGLGFRVVNIVAKQK